MRIAKRWTMAVLLVCVAALIGGLATRTERGAAWLSEASGGRLAGPEAEDASAADAASAAAADGAGQQAGSTAASPSSPPRDDDGDDLLSLMRRAEAGDTHAQCEAASVVINCEGARKYVDGLRRTREMHTERVRTLPESDLLRAESERWLERSRIHGDPVYIAFDECKQPYQPSRADVLRLLRESAESGDPVAVDVYLSGRLLQDEDGPEIRQERLLYQTRAEAIARRAVARGNVVAALMLTQAYVQPDDARADLSLGLLPTAVTQDLPTPSPICTRCALRWTRIHAARAATG